MTIQTKDYWKNHISALASWNGSVSAYAKLHRISKSTLYYRMRTNPGSRAKDPIKSFTPIHITAEPALRVNIHKGHTTFEIQGISLEEFKNLFDMLGNNS